MYFQIFEDERLERRIIKIELTKNDIKYLLKEKSLTEFDFVNDVRIELKETK